VVNLLHKDQKLQEKGISLKLQLKECLVRSTQLVVQRKEKIQQQVSSFLNNLKLRLKLPDVTGDHSW